MTQKTPSFLGKIASFSRAMWLSIRLLVAGEPVLVSEAQQKARLKVCSVCENLQGAEFHSCKICGCLLDAKSLLRQPGCPAGYWDGVDKSFR